MLRMKKMSKRWISLLLAVVLVLGVSMPAGAANHPFTDVAAGSWYEGAVEFV